jgi:hypothetical protein
LPTLSEEKRWSYLLGRQIKHRGLGVGTVVKVDGGSSGSPSIVVGFDSELGATRRIPALVLITECLWLHVPEDFPSSPQVPPSNSYPARIGVSTDTDEDRVKNVPAWTHQRTSQVDAAAITAAQPSHAHSAAVEARRWEAEWIDKRIPETGASACKCWWEAGNSVRARAVGKEVIDAVRSFCPMSWDDSLSMVRVLGRHYVPEQGDEEAHWSFFGRLVNRAKSYDSIRSRGSESHAMLLAALMAARVASDRWLSGSEIIVAMPGSNPDKVYDLPRFVALRLRDWLRRCMVRVTSSGLHGLRGR